MRFRRRAYERSWRAFTIVISASEVTHTPSFVPSRHAAVVDEVAARVTQAHAVSTPLRIVGSGTWTDVGRPIHAELELSCAELTGVIEYVPGDLVITVGAGATLDDLAEITAEHGQWFALDPIGDPRGTIGATVATASSGPLALASGTIRDLVLGLGIISGTGTQLHVGGRVVKNVAGFDLVRLATGAFGTLGVITDVSLRLHARPAADATFSIAHSDADALIGIIAKLGHDALALHALELLSPLLAQDIGAGDGSSWVLLARATGNAATVASQRATLASRATVHEVDPTLWRALRMSDGAGATVRLSAPPAHLARTITQAEHATSGAGLSDTRLQATPHRGIVRVVMPASSAPYESALAALGEDHDARVAVVVQSLRAHAHRVLGERLPTTAWNALPAAARDPVSQRIRDAFDPHRIMNRGIFGEEGS